MAFRIIASGSVDLDEEIHNHEFMQDGTTPMNEAVRSRLLRIVKALVSNGAKCTKEHVSRITRITDSFKY